MPQYKEYTMKTSMTILFMCLCLSFFSCDFFVEKENDGEEPPYTARVAWDSGLFSNDYGSHTVDGNFVYFYERPPGFLTTNIYSLTKLDAETGRLIWRSLTFSNIVFCQPIAIGGYVYVFLQPNLIICFDNETGDWTATVEVDIDDKNLEFEWNISAYERYLYMGLCRNGRYFVRLDVNGITHGTPESLQKLTPEILWVPETGNYITAKQIVYKNTVYTNTYSANATEPVELAGFDTDSGQRVFRVTFGGPEDGDVPYPERGGTIDGNPILIHDDVLYHLSRSISAWDLKTGERLYRHVFGNDVPLSKRYMAGGCLQPVYYNGKIYFTQSINYEGPEDRNIHCIDAETGELVWNAIAKYSETLDTNPIIAHGRLYVSQYSGLRVYDHETGKLIGVDKSFCGAGMGRNVLYKDYMICVRKNPNNGDDGRMVAVYVGE
jgi:outer membrane protein assembly factor BamB